MDNEKFQELVLEQFQNIASELKSLNQRFSNLEEGQQRLETRVGGLEVRLERVDEGQQRLEARVGGLEETVGRLDARVGNLDAKVDKLDARLEKVEKGQQRLETRMESEVIEKLRALFDDRELQNDRLARIEDKLEKTSNDTTYLVLETARLRRIAR